MGHGGGSQPVFLSGPMTIIRR
ncbi:hypothetical protein CGLO_08213 [Colletotrichum gloeosporioides Cg-14]|uniref:Uncharacterized protein n=1 Tax=Colletotrichum gloeosporioides (strain Cg-14) TaxID=1237896 RepID=T0K9G5_COLGC|nr:hypothetical protein CGLO_08213 [Colletotrichum gloeosporioides Cg-14]